MTWVSGISGFSAACLGARLLPYELLSAAYAYAALDFLSTAYAYAYAALVWILQGCPMGPGEIKPSCREQCCRDALWVPKSCRDALWVPER